MLWLEDFPETFMVKREFYRKKFLILNILNLVVLSILQLDNFFRVIFSSNIYENLDKLL